MMVVFTDLDSVGYLTVVVVFFSSTVPGAGGLTMVVFFSILVSSLAGGFTMMVLSSFLAGGFTIVVLLSVFSAGNGVTRASQAQSITAAAIGMMWCVFIVLYVTWVR